MRKSYWWKMTCVAAAFSFPMAVGAPAQTFTSLYSFQGPPNDGNFPWAGLVQATDGNLYGTTEGSIAPIDWGTVFKISPEGAETTLYMFCAQTNCDDGSAPLDQLIQGTDGNFYGTNSDYGVYGSGTVFKITPAGTLTTLHTCNRFVDGSEFTGGLVEVPDGNFYGTTHAGPGNQYGTIFKITPAGSLTTMDIFYGYQNNGGEPLDTLVLGADGNLWGTLLVGNTLSSPGGGAVFKVTPSGSLRIVLGFEGADGAEPYAGVTQGLDGNFYGTTAQGGANNACANGCGTVFKMTPDGALTTLYSFCAQADCADGNSPSGLLQATDGNYYGATGGGTINNDCWEGCGTVFKITPGGTLTTLHTFDYTDGAWPSGQLLEDTNGNIYGTTEGGGTAGYSTVFELATGLHPFVVTRPNIAKVGQRVVILGTDLASATSVTFNGTPAKIFAKSNSSITATVPTGATRGPVVVVTPRGKLVSNFPFRVAP